MVDQMPIANRSRSVELDPSDKKDESRPDVVCLVGTRQPSRIVLTRRRWCRRSGGSCQWGGKGQILGVDNQMKVVKQAESVHLNGQASS